MCISCHAPCSQHGSVWLLLVISLLLTNTVSRVRMSYTYDWSSGEVSREPKRKRALLWDYCISIQTLYNNSARSSTFNSTAIHIRTCRLLEDRRVPQHIALRTPSKTILEIAYYVFCLLKKLPPARLDSASHFQIITIFHKNTLS